ncbi:hypothetical protein LVJ94_34785 [Pendulispora rubella]|uniref:Uncharacterized protein n=1 Tax=Pendulispora rubella TaxID=2741070 RepID=A0ABZ2L0F0_9BACT
MPPPDLHNYLRWLARRLADDADDGLEPIVLRALETFGQPDFVPRATEALARIVQSGPAALGAAQEAQLRDILARLLAGLAPLPDGSPHESN